MKTYFSPVIFLSMFATTSRHSNPLFQPNGLDMVIDGSIVTDKDLFLSAKRNVIIKETATIEATGSANIMFEAGTTGNGIGDVIFEGSVPSVFLEDGTLTIYYNPTPRAFNTHKYANPRYFGNYVNERMQQKAYMWVNDVYDLYNIRVFLAGNYALSKDIESNKAINKINNGEGFTPIQLPQKKMAFVGHFDGRNHAINNLEIKCSNMTPSVDMFDGCGIFGVVVHGKIKNLTINNCSVEGDYYVGALFGVAFEPVIENISITGSKAKGRAVVGRLGGAVESLHGTISGSKDILFSSIKYDEKTTVEANEYQGELIGLIGS